MWSGEKPHEYRESTLHPEKIGMWCGMSRKRIVGPTFFTSTITGDVYQDIIEQFLSQLEKSEHRSWLQQDNARPHVSMNTMSFLCEFSVSVCVPPLTTAERSIEKTSNWTLT